MSSPTTSSTAGPSSNLIASNTRPAKDLAENAIKQAIFRSRLSVQAATSEETTAEAVASFESASTTVSFRSALESSRAPSMEDALSIPFIDVKAIGVQTWPIRGTEKWEGRILEVDRDIFTAELTPLDGDDRATLVSEFRTKVLEAGEQGIQPGDLFYMTARPVRIRGLLTTSYSLQIRRPGNWTPKDLSEIRERARQRLEMLKDNVE